MINPTSDDVRAHFWTAHDFVILGGVLAVVSALFWWVTPNQALYVTDSIYYVGSAQSLALGQGYHCPMLAGNPANGFYPPLQSIYLSIAWVLNPTFPDNQIILKALMLFLWGATLATLFAVLKKGGLGRHVAAMIVLVVGTSGVWAYFVIHCFSDILFALLAFTGMWLWINPQPRSTYLRIAVTGVILAMMYLTRIAALGFIPGAVLASAVVSYRLRVWKPILLLVPPIALAMVAWALAPRETVGYGSWFSGELAAAGGYGAWIQHLLSRCFFQSWDYLNGNHLFQNFSTDLPGVLTSFASPGNEVWEAIVQGILSILGVVFIAICARGAYHSDRERPLQAAVGTYILQVLFWPFPLGFRGLLPLLPLFLLWASRGAKYLREPWAKVYRLIALIYLIACLVSNFAAAPETRRLLDRSVMVREAAATGRWVDQMLPHGAAIASDFRLPMLHIYEASHHPIYHFENTTLALAATQPKIAYLISYAQYDRGKIIGNEEGPRLKVIWESPHGKFQVLQIIRSSI